MIVFCNVILGGVSCLTGWPFENASLQWGSENVIFHVVTFLKPTVRFTTAYPSGVSQNGLRRGLEYEPSKNEFAK